MGTWGSAPWENDGAADWLDNLFQKTKLAKDLRLALKKDTDSYYEEMRTAAFMVAALHEVLPVDDRFDLLSLAAEKLAEILSRGLYEEQEFNALLEAEKDRLEELRDKAEPPKVDLQKGLSPDGRFYRCPHYDCVHKDEELAAFLEPPFQNVEEIELRGSPISGSGLSHLRALEKLRSLRFEMPFKLTNEAPQAIAKLTQLSTLVVSFGAKVTVKALCALRLLQNLEELTLGFGGRPGDLTFLAGLSKLRTLALVGFEKWADTDFNFLNSLHSLSTLRLTLMGKNSVAVLSHLSSLKSLRALFLDYLPFSCSSDDLSFLSDFKNLETCSFGSGSVTHFQPYRISKEFIERLSRTVSNLEFSGGLELEPGAFAPLAEFKQLKRIKLRLVQEPENVPVGDLCNIETLEELDSDHSNANLAAIGSIAKLQRLRTPDLSGAKLPDETFDALVRLRSLEELCLNFAAGITADGLKKLAVLPALKTIGLLALREAPLDPALVSEFGKLRPDVKIRV